MLALLGGTFALDLSGPNQELARAVIKLFGSAALLLKSQRPNWNLYFLHTITLCHHVQVIMLATTAAALWCHLIEFC